MWERSFFISKFAWKERLSALGLKLLTSLEIELLTLHSSYLPRALIAFQLQHILFIERFFICWPSKCLFSHFISPPIFLSLSPFVSSFSDLFLFFSSSFFWFSGEIHIYTTQGHEDQNRWYRGRIHLDLKRLFSEKFQYCLCSFLWLVPFSCKMCLYFF